MTVAAILFAIAAAAGLAAKSFGPRTPELGLDIFLSHGRNGALIAVSEAIHYGLGPAGAVALVLIICGYLLWFRGRPVQALAFGSVIAAGWLASTAGKILVSRSRPPADATGSLVAETGNNSFPSGHTAFAVSLALATVLVLTHGTMQRLTVLAAGLLFVAVVAFSRIYLGVHYLTDVIGSVLISSAAILAWLPLWNNLIAPRISGGKLIRRLEVRTSKRGRPVDPTSCRLGGAGPGNGDFCQPPAFPDEKTAQSSGHGGVSPGLVSAADRRALGAEPGRVRCRLCSGPRRRACLERRMRSLRFAVAALGSQMIRIAAALGFLAAARQMMGTWTREISGTCSWARAQ